MLEILCMEVIYMGNALVLSDEQKKLRDKLKELNEKAWDIVNNRDYSSQQEINEVFYEMAKTAHNLHMSLKESGHEPKHHRYMIENRGVPVEDVEFYNHVHPVDDLLKFLDDVNANDDPEDTTIGKEFNLKIYTRRWGHYDTYKVIRTEEGWNFKGLMTANTGECDKSCSPHLCNSLDHDCVCYPKQIGEFMEYLWNQAAEGLTEDEVRESIDMVGEWISSCEMNTPRGIFEGLI